MISLGPYSGKATPPLYGDFEAQRHWLEITSNLPRNQWYTYSADHWPLDYPPLTAWHSYGLGKLAQSINSSWVELDKSRGNEDYNLVLFMRFTVILSDLLILVPGIISILKEFKTIPALLFLLQPSLILIDNGHFQYNCVMLGFFALAIANFFKEKWAIGCIFFVSCLLFKQMGLFWSLPIFFYLLGIILLLIVGISIKKGYKTFLKISITTLLSLLIGFGSITTHFSQVSNILFRIFPFQRGLWEDKVANFWCWLNIFVKIRQIFKLDFLILSSTLITLVVVLPVCILLLITPSKQNFIYSLIISSLGFFLFSFQVHEKSILMPAFTMNLLWPRNPRLVIWFNTLAVFSMMPLLIREGLGLISILVVIFYQLILYDSTLYMESITYALMLLILGGEYILGNPRIYPHLFTVLNVEISAILFMATLGYIYYEIYKMQNGKNSKKRK